MGKFDFYATRTTALRCRFGYNKEPIINPFFGANVTGFSCRYDTTWDYFGNIGYTKTISVSTLNEFLVTAQRLYSDRHSHQPSAHTLRNWESTCNRTIRLGPPTLSFASGMTVGFDPNVHWKADNNYAISDTLTWNRGRHTFQVRRPLRDHAGEFRLRVPDQRNLLFLRTRSGLAPEMTWPIFLFGASDEFRRILQSTQQRAPKTICGICSGRMESNSTPYVDLRTSLRVHHPRNRYPWL